jgi:hypothetical protein
MNAPIKTVRDRYSGERIAAFYAGGYWHSASGKVQKHILRADIKNKLEEEARVR